MSNILNELESLQTKLKEAEVKKIQLKAQLDLVNKEIQGMGFQSIQDIMKEKEKIAQEIIVKELNLQNEIDRFKSEFGELINER